MKKENRALRLKRFLKEYGAATPWDIMRGCRTCKYTNAVSELRALGVKVVRRVVAGVPTYSLR